MSQDLAARFVDAIASHDRAALAALLAPDVDFRGLTPGRSWEASDPAQVVGVLLDHWFEDTDRIEEVTSVEHGEDVADVARVAYRFQLLNDAGPQVAEQQAYYRVADGRLSYLRIMCSGFRPRPK
ncbi:nuclear transport factor 2 family protein [Nocardioides ferulae]|uniref:nuclear transport factor 2 family protein n=1 Tax=Nocardioides ferulae TaxID=2340821 RepID=UPI0013DE6464|nr:nuclear transport factor 2 family protein [Nocardioides ferulae]